MSVFIRGVSRTVRTVTLRSVDFLVWRPTCCRCLHNFHKNGFVKYRNRQIMRQLSTGVKLAPEKTAGSYEEAVHCLNTLQSNAAYLAKTAAERDKRRHHQLQLTLQTADRVGVTPEDLDRLSVIHVTGTKGKGSTCAISESILRRQGYRTGFFSSPHLIEVRERIRIGGSPLSREAFRNYFWQCYNKLYSSKDEFGGYMPPYFQFLTVMAFHVFLEEQVDVVILEVGIGGEYDSTNIISNPVVCGISSLGIDHVSLLGDTVEKIAWHKGGIFKSGAPALTVQQPDGSMEVLQQRAIEKGCPVSVVPSSIHSYDWGGAAKTLGIPGEKQDLNASLAVQLCSVFTMLHEKSIHERKEIQKDFVNGTAPKADYLSEKYTFRLSEPVIEGLQKCYWPGRCQTVKRPGISYFVDGAHTPRSIMSSAHWFNEVSAAEANSIAGKTVKVLLFNSTGDRKADTLLSPLLSCQFDCVVFCPNITTTLEGNKADQTNFMVTNSLMLSKCQENQKTWDRILKDHTLELDKPVDGSGDNKPANHNNNTTPPCSVSFGCILEALHWVTQGRSGALPQIPHNVEESTTIRSADHVQVLCTGSLYLVGGILGLIHPDVCEGPGRLDC